MVAKKTIFFVVIFIIGFITLIYMHETAHQEIYRYYGVDAEIDMLRGFDAVTEADEPCPTNQCDLAHNINEIVGYHLEVFYLVFGVGFMVIIEIKESENQLNKTGG